MRHDIPNEVANYNPNCAGAQACPFLSSLLNGGQGFASASQPLSGEKIRKRSATFSDHFSQAASFYRSQTSIGQKHIQDAFSFELGKVTRIDVRHRYLGILTVIDRSLAERVAHRLGLEVPAGLAEETIKTVQQIFPDYSVESVRTLEVYPSLSVEYNSDNASIATRRVAALLADGFDFSEFSDLEATLANSGAELLVLAANFGQVTATNGEHLQVEHTFLTMDSVLFDSVYLVGGRASQASVFADPHARMYLRDSFQHCKILAIGGTEIAETKQMLMQADVVIDAGVCFLNQPDGTATYVQQLGQHRFWERELAAPAI